MANSDKTSTPPHRMQIVGIQVPMYDLIVLLVKLVIAAIPAAFIVFVLFAAGSAVLGGLFKGIGV